MQSRSVIALSLSSIALAVVIGACAEATDGIKPDAGSVVGEADAETPAADATDSGKRAADGGRPFFDAGNLSADAVIINEISASDDWVELVNSGTTAADVSGYMLADQDKVDGTPKKGDAVTLPPGTILSPKSYLIVQAGGLDGGPACPVGEQSYCFPAEFGISNKDGETLFLLAPDGKVVGSAVYPPSAAAAGQTWGRMPSGAPTGAFEPTLPTPGAVNAKP